MLIHQKRPMQLKIKNPQCLSNAFQRGGKGWSAIVLVSLYQIWICFMIWPVNSFPLCPNKLSSLSIYNYLKLHYVSNQHSLELVQLIFFCLTEEFWFSLCKYKRYIRRKHHTDFHYREITLDTFLPFLSLSGIDPLDSAINQNWNTCST